VQLVACLFLEEIEKCLAVTVFYPGRRRAASLFFHKDLRLEQRAKVIDAFIRDTHFHRFYALVARGRIEVQAIAACMQVRAAILALVCGTDMFHDLNLLRAIVAARNQVEFCFDPSSRSFGPRRRFRLSFPVGIHIAGLTVFSRHSHPQKSGGRNKNSSV
jgi:hypothetical protein